jgi:hypothetical protein
MFTLSSACPPIPSLASNRHEKSHLPTMDRSIFDQRVTSGRQLKAHVRPTDNSGKVMSFAYLRGRVKNERQK